MVGNGTSERSDAWADDRDAAYSSTVYSRLIIVGASAALALLAILVLVGVPLAIHLLEYLRDQLGPLQDSITFSFGAFAAAI